MNVVTNPQRLSSMRQLLESFGQRMARLASRSFGAITLRSPAQVVKGSDDPLPRREWDHREIYIVGGGPSVKDIDLSLLADKTVIAVNYAIFSLPNAAYFLTLDPRFFAKVRDRQAEIDAHPATKVLVHNWPTDHVVVRSDRLTVGPSNADFSAFPLIIRSTRADGFGRTFFDFRHGVNSGYCAVQLALLLGARRIHLLGFDLTIGVNGEHFHNAYRLDPKCLPSYTRHFRAGLKTIAEQWPGVSVISHSPVSVLNDLIPFEPLT